MRKLMIAAALASSALAAPAMADSSPATLTINLTADVLNTCTVDANQLDPQYNIGTLGISAAGTDVTIPVKLTCSTGEAYWVSAASANDDGSDHFLVSTGGSNKILYRAYWGANATPIPLVATDHSVGGSGTNAEVTQDLRIAVPAETNPNGRQPGAYRDALILSINW